MVIEVACGVILDGDKVFCVRRSEAMSLPLKWEFPGGKIEDGETAEDCLKRELLEELEVRVLILEKLSNSYFDYGNFQINLIPYICKFLGDKIILREHKEYLWLPVNELISLDWAPSDIPIVHEIISRNQKNR
ncbi:MAG TPA: (deoxy)nucleoside triphosphate pyrophosphohydrolase [Saprospiraceae bacterium]|nr:(deoxy)nucleoside triphosphate pyrophosphohydrolase [Saprospiraceae bacterium]HMU02882.1 (deoxy)nucleoside triphosphate pyrophosphohydrolase [Saprospiraceae bacterium]